MKSIRPQLLGCILAGLTACSSATGINGNGGPVSGPAASLPAPGRAVTAVIAGIGDSLTAGYQSGALSGVTVPNPFYPATSALPVIPATQTNGFWPLLWAAANGATPASAPLPFINGPGLGAFLVPLKNGSFQGVQGSCAGLNAAAFDRNAAAGARTDPNRTIYDVAVPSQTLHEAIYQTQPIGPCAPNAADLLGPLEPVVYGENVMFYPILGTSGATQLQAVLGLRPSLTTVWLGSNDVLKFVFTNGNFPAPDAGQFAQDMQKIVSSLVAGGSNVAVANIYPIFSAPVMIPVPKAGAILTAILTQILVTNGVAPAVAQATAAAVAPGAVASVTTQYGLGPNGFITFAGGAKIVSAVVAALLAQQPPPAKFSLALGDFVSDNVAQQGQALIDAYNAAIAGVVQGNAGAVLVDINGAFGSYAAAGGIPINPGKCCTLGFGGGLFSFDQLHPSNTGYAVVANLFISAINKQFFAGIAPVNVTTVYAADPYAPH